MSRRTRRVGTVVLTVAAVAYLVWKIELDTTLEDTRLKGAALILDARIDPQLKFEIAPRLSDSVETEDPRGGLERVFADPRDEVDDGLVREGRPEGHQHDEAQQGDEHGDEEVTP